LVLKNTIENLNEKLINNKNELITKENEIEYLKEKAKNAEYELQNMQ